VQLKDIMLHDVARVRPEDALREATEKMKSLAIDPLPVWDGCGIVGMLTSQNIQKTVAKAGLAAGSVSVHDAMTQEVVRSYEDQDMVEAASLLEKSDGSELNGLLVFDRSEHLVGFARSTDIKANEPISKHQVTGAIAGSQPTVDFQRDPVDSQSEDSYPASDPPSSSNYSG
jgi:predicted transcriptional regulator